MPVPVQPWRCAAVPAAPSVPSLLPPSLPPFLPPSLPPSMQENVEGRYARFEEHMGSLQSVLTPTQRVRLVLWVTK